MRIAILTILCTGLLAEEIEIIPEWKTVPEEISEIATLEMTIENRLRDDKHDKLLQIDIDESIARMEKLIKDAEEIEIDSPDDGRKRDLLKLKYSAGSSRPDRKPPCVSGTDPKDKVVYDHRDSDEWARLSRSMRGEIVQVYATDLPLLWKKRIAAYFISVNADDTPKK